jgi:hypothetical protein
VLEAKVFNSFHLRKYAKHKTFFKVPIKRNSALSPELQRAQALSKMLESVGGK